MLRLPVYKIITGNEITFLRTFTGVWHCGNIPQHMILCFQNMSVIDCKLKEKNSLHSKRCTTKIINIYKDEAGVLQLWNLHSELSQRNLMRFHAVLAVKIFYSNFLKKVTMSGIQYMRGSLLLIIWFDEPELTSQMMVAHWLHSEGTIHHGFVTTGTLAELERTSSQRLGAQTLLMQNQLGWSGRIWATSMATVESDCNSMSYYSWQQWWRWHLPYKKAFFQHPINQKLSRHDFRKKGV